MLCYNCFSLLAPIYYVICKYLKSCKVRIYNMIQTKICFSLFHLLCILGAEICLLKYWLIMLSWNINLAKCLLLNVQSPTKPHTTSCCFSSLTHQRFMTQKRIATWSRRRYVATATLLYITQIVFKFQVFFSNNSI